MIYNSKIIKSPWPWLILVFIAFLLTLAKYTTFKIRVAFAEGQVAIFNTAEATAVQTTNPRILTGQLQYVTEYYPSGTKQIKGSRLDRIVEASRSNAVRAIIVRLRVVTEKDFGDDPSQWIKAFPPL